MSVASSVPCLKISNPSNPCSSTSTTSSIYRFSTTKPNYVGINIRSSQAEGPIRRPSPVKPTPPTLSPPPSTTAPPSSSPPKPAPAALGGQSVITLEFQRQKAKELQDYFKQKKLEAADQGPFFGFLGKNEISNGRWAMFGFAVGMLTEYATGSDFVDQVKILFSNFGILDLE
ncbi:hypothetical protein ACFE04_006818 [Oxalis oulophora]